MAPKNKNIPVTAVDHIYCSFDGWQRNFRFGVNRRRPIKELDEREGGFDDWDHLEVFGTVHHHDANRKTRNRKGQKVILWIFPTHVPRDNWRDDPEAVGGVWTEGGKLYGSLRLAADTYYSLFPCLLAGVFKEIQATIRDMKYRRGKLDRMEFSPTETSIEDLG